MFALQSLHVGQIPTIIISGQGRVFLSNPYNGLISITVEVLDLMGTKESLLALKGQTLQSLPALVKLLPRHKITKSDQSASDQ